MYIQKYVPIVVILLILLVAVIGIIIHNHKKYSPTPKSRNIRANFGANLGANYSPSKSPSGHDCKTSSATCSNPGSGICTPSSCNNVDNKICFDDKAFCEYANRCDEDNGWTSNANNSDCNIFKCTKDGNLFDRSNPGNNGDNLYEYSNNINADYPGEFCWRKGIGKPEPNIEQYCQQTFPIDCTGHTHDPRNKANVTTDEWGNYECSNFNSVCVSTLEDTAPLVTKVTGAPTYMYPNNTTHGGNHQMCWNQSPTDRRIHFYYQPSIIANGDKNCQV